MSADNLIEIGDLLNPDISESLRATLELTAGITVDLSVDAVIAAAQEQTGLTNFGGTDFMPHLAKVLECYDTEGRLTNHGRVSAFAMLVNYLKNRLKLEELYRRHPEIESEQIVAPIIIAGLPRSGTTHLHNALAVDPRLRGLPYYEALAPVPDTFERVAGPEKDDPRYVACVATLQNLNQCHPAYRAMHEMSADYVHEEIDLLAMEFVTAEFSVLAYVPSYEDYMKSVDQRPAYAYLVRALKALQWLRGPRRWVLKSPQHMSRLEVLNETFPDATIAFTHREPVSVIASMTTMIAYVMRVSQNLDLHDTGQYWLRHIGEYLHGVTRDRDLIPADRSIDIPFPSFVADNMAHIDRVYATAKLALDGDERSAVVDYVSTYTSHRHGRIEYDLEQFGLSADAIRAEFGDYIKRFGL